MYNVVLIHGFFGWGKRTPLFNTFPNYWPKELLTREDINCIIVDIGMISSDHDRACETFYQLKGGQVDYGEEHSNANGHKRYGETYVKGYFVEWDEYHPIHIVGHSYGATTALELYQLLCKDYFNIGSNHSWISSITSIAGPLSGTTLTHALGLNAENKIEHLSLGHILGIIIGSFWKLQISIPWFKNLIDFGVPQWNRHNNWNNIISAQHPMNLSHDNGWHCLTPSLRQHKNTQLVDMDKIYLFSIVCKAKGFVLPSSSFIFRTIFFALLLNLTRNSFSSLSQFLPFKIILKALKKYLRKGLLTNCFSPLSWYAHPFLVTFLYACPSVLGVLVVFNRFIYLQRIKVKDPLTPFRMEKTLFEASSMILWLFLALLTFYQLASAYIFTLWLFFSLIGQSTCNKLKNSKFFTPLRYITIRILVLSYPFLHTGQLLLLGYQVFIPIMGRAGTILPPDLIIALYSGVGVTLLLLSFTSLLAFVSSKAIRKFQAILVFFTILFTFYACFINSYSRNHPKRLFIFHVERYSNITNNYDSGLWIIPCDYKGMNPISNELKSSFNLIKDPKAFLEDDSIYSNFPWSKYLPTKKVIPISTTWYIPNKKPILSNSHSSISLDIVSSNYNKEKNIRTLHFLLSGPSHITMYIDAKKTKLISWSLGNGTDSVPPEKDCYFIYIANGKPPTKLNFWFQVQGNQLLNISFAGFYFDLETPQLDHVTSVLPDWITSLKAVAVWRSASF